MQLMRIIITKYLNEFKSALFRVIMEIGRAIIKNIVHFCIRTYFIMQDVANLQYLNL